MSVLKTLLYFSIFNYPITKEEIYRYSKINTIEEVSKQLDYLLSKNVIYQFGSYFSIENNKNYVSRREIGNQKAEAILPKAKKVSGFIAKFPYVESVSISGALSKGYYDDVDGDFDFFIITKPNRLWIARTLLIIYKKVFLLNSKKYFCVNYFIGSNQLSIAERNRFTATEIVTLLPFYGKEAFSQFITNNRWTTLEFPNIESVNFEAIKTLKKPFLSRFLELILNTSFGNTLDDFFRKLTLKKWQKSFGYLSKEDFEIAMKSTKNVSKHHPQNFQKKVILSLEDSYNNIVEKYNLEYV